jgi:hypothetical protein
MAADKEKSQDQGEKKPPKLECEISSCQHDPGKFSLKILIGDHHTDLSAYPWSHKPGCQAAWIIFDLTPDNVMALGNAILETSWRMKQGQEQPKVQPESTSAPPRHVDPKL